jgi:hypothetical protein
MNNNMNKNTKTALIVALSLFGTGVLIWLCISIGIGFQYSKLFSGTAAAYSGIDAAQFKTEHIEKSFDEQGQEIVLNLSYADVTIEPSTDGQIHLTYDNSENSYFELKETDRTLRLTQRTKNTLFPGVTVGVSERLDVLLRLPAGRSGELSVGGASSRISASDLELQDEMLLSGVSGDLTVINCKAPSIDASTTSGEIRLHALETKRLQVGSVSGEIELSEIGGGVTLSLSSTSGAISVQEVEAGTLSAGTVSGKITLDTVSGESAKLSSTSGNASFKAADFQTIKFSTVSGDLSGTVVGKAEDYTVHTDTVSGSNGLSGHRERGKRTLDLSSTSGSFALDFAG